MTRRYVKDGVVVEIEQDEFDGYKKYGIPEEELVNDYVDDVIYQHRKNSNPDKKYGIERDPDKEYGDEKINE
jgi:hypothetical protein